MPEQTAPSRLVVAGQVAAGAAVAAWQLVVELVWLARPLVVVAFAEVYRRASEPGRVSMGVVALVLTVLAVRRWAAGEDRP